MEKAIEKYSEAIQLYSSEHPDLILAYSNRAAALLAKGEFESAMSDSSSGMCT